MSLINTDDIVCMDDGFWCFWPTTNKGAYTPSNLREIADALDKRNADWQKIVEEQRYPEKCVHCGEWTMERDMICRDCVPF